MADKEISLCWWKNLICIICRAREAENVVEYKRKTHAKQRIFSLSLTLVFSKSFFDVEANGRAAEFMITGLDSAHSFYQGLAKVTKKISFFMLNLVTYLRTLIKINLTPQGFSDVCKKKETTEVD